MQHLVSIDYLREHHGSQHWKWLANGMLTGEGSLRQVYFRDGLQKQSNHQVFGLVVIKVAWESFFLTHQLADFIAQRIAHSDDEDEDEHNGTCTPCF